MLLFSSFALQGYVASFAHIKCIVRNHEDNYAIVTTRTAENGLSKHDHFEKYEANACVEQV